MLNSLEALKTIYMVRKDEESRRAYFPGKDVYVRLVEDTKRRHNINFIESVSNK